MNEQEQVPLSLQVPQEMMDRLNALAEKQMLARSDVVRHILAREIGMLESDGERGAVYKSLFYDYDDDASVSVHLCKWAFDGNAQRPPVTDYVLEEKVGDDRFLSALDEHTETPHAKQEAIHIRYAIQRFDALVEAQREKMGNTTKD